MFKIVRREEMAEGTVILNEIEAPLIAKKAKPGQFVILKANETGERIPLTMADTDPQKGTITVIYMVVGKSTAIFKSLKVGDGYMDIIGPLGKPTHLEKVGNVVCVGGGTGVAVLHPITRALKEVGNHVTCIIGARNKELLILEDQMKAASHELLVCTDDGSYGRKGFVTEALKDVLENIFKLMLVEGKGMEALNTLPDKKIIDTDTIGVGTGAVDYYYSEAVNHTFKYERQNDVILDKRASETSAF